MSDAPSFWQAFSEARTMATVQGSNRLHVALDGVRDAHEQLEQRLSTLEQKARAVVEELVSYPGRVSPPRLRDTINALAAHLDAQEAHDAGQ